MIPSQLLTPATSQWRFQITAALKLAERCLRSPWSSVVVLILTDYRTTFVFLNFKQYYLLLTLIDIWKNHLDLYKSVINKKKSFK